MYKIIVDTLLMTQVNRIAGAEEAACQIDHGEEGYQVHKWQKGNKGLWPQNRSVGIFKRLL